MAGKYRTSPHNAIKMGFCGEAKKIGEKRRS
jgi:hypothetical protein